MCLRGGTELVASCDRYSRENEILARDLRLSDETNRHRYTSCVALTLSSRLFLIALPRNRNLHSRRLDHLSKLLALPVLCFDRLNCRASSNLPEHGSKNSAGVSYRKLITKYSRMRSGPFRFRAWETREHCFMSRAAPRRVSARCASKVSVVIVTLPPCSFDSMRSFVFLCSPFFHWRYSGEDTYRN